MPLRKSVRSATVPMKTLPEEYTQALQFNLRGGSGEKESADSPLMQTRQDRLDCSIQARGKEAI
ncbi:MAG: hypothetical protein AAB433_22435 [Nitrospirota bacterium]